MAFEWILKCIWVCCIIGIVVNCLVLYIVYTASARMGFFKYLLIFFTLIEIAFCIIVFFAQPFFYAHDYRLIVYSHSDIPIFAETILGKIAIGLYCTFYELWMGMVVLLFVFKYIVLCRRNVVEKVEHYWYLKVLILVIYLIYFAYSMVCGIFWCNNTIIPESTHNHIQEVIHRYADRNYLVLTFTAYDGSFSFSGFMAAFDHVAYALLTGVISVYCGRKIWETILQMQKNQVGDYNRHAEVFYTLVLQAAVPFILYELPTSFFVLDALFEKDPILTNFIPIWPLFISLPKAIDPFIILFLIKDYRVATRNLFQHAISRIFSCITPLKELGKKLRVHRSPSIGTTTNHGISLN